MFVFHPVLIILAWMSYSVCSGSTVESNQGAYPLIRLRTALVPVVAHNPSPAQDGQQQPLILVSQLVPTYIYRRTIGPSSILPGGGSDDEIDVGQPLIRARSGLVALPIPEVEQGTSGQKPRCLTSLFSWYAKKKVMGAIENMGGGGGPSGMQDLPAPPNLQGGIIQGGGPGGSFNSGLNQASNALNNANLMENQVNQANAQFNQFPLSSYREGAPIAAQDKNGSSEQEENLPISPSPPPVPIGEHLHDDEDDQHFENFHKQQAVLTR